MGNWAFSIGVRSSSSWRLELLTLLMGWKRRLVKGPEAWISSRALLFPRFRRCARQRGRRPHARAPRYFWHTEDRAAFVAHVFCAVHRRVVHISGAATSIPRFITKDRRACCSEFSATDINDLLADPSSLQKCIQENVSAPRKWRLFLTNQAFDLTAAKRGACQPLLQEQGSQRPDHSFNSNQSLVRQTVGPANLFAVIFRKQYRVA